MIHRLFEMPPKTQLHDPSRLASLAAFGILDTPPEQGFDDIVHMASEGCAAPTALVSLVAADRQWFKARVGFPDCQTDLNASVCVHALDAPDLLVIPDLTQDARTDRNPLVTGDHHLRFYAGAPLRTRDGAVLGSLCVIDVEPRPHGLTPAEADLLKRLARQAVAQLELRRAVAERDAALDRERREQERAVADAARLEAMIATQQAVAGAGADLDAIFQAVVDGCLTVIDGASGAVVEMREGDALVYRTTSGTSVPHRGMRLPLRGTLSGRSLLSETPIACDDTRDDPAVDQDLAARLGIRSLVVTPVSRHGVAIGLLKVQSGEPGAFSARDIRMAQMLAGLVAASFGDVGEARTRRALRAAEDRYKAIFDSAVDFAIVAADPAGLVTDWNDGAQQIMGWAPDDIRGEPIARIFTPEDRDGGVPEREMHRATTAGSSSDERWHVKRDGERFWALGRMMALRHDDGALRGYLKILQDRTAQRLAQQALQDSEGRAAAGEAYWRGLFEHLSEGFLVGEVVRDPSGAIDDWRYVDVNAAWGELVGQDPASVIGRTVRAVLPDIEPAWIDDFAEVVRTGTGTTFTRQVGSLQRWYEGRSFRLTSERFGVIFLEVTARIKAEARQAALLDLGLVLRDAADAASMTQAACAIVGETIRAGRVGFGQVSEDGQVIDIEADWTAPSIVSVAGRHRFDDYGHLRADIEAGRLLVIDDVRSDPRTAGDPGRLLGLGIGSLVNVPVRERGRTVALFIVHDARARAWTEEEVAFLRTVADRVQVAVARLAAEANQAILNEELSHRLKNTLAMVQSIATQTLKGVTDRAAVDAFKQRLVALSTAHDVLLQQSWASAPIDRVIRGTLALHADPSRIVTAGLPIRLGPKAVLSLTLLMHELATNAVKYGALSVPGGTVRVAWSVDHADELVVTWAERDGPAASEPARRGFGTRLIGTGICGTGSAALHYLDTGLHAEFRAPLGVVTEP